MPLLVQTRPDQQQHLVSIIIPCFNAAEHLPKAIRSVLEQTYTNIEVIVVDDGSSDDSAAIASELAKTDPRVKVTALLRNFGCYYARNVGVMHARGKYIGICDSDDILPPDRLVKQVAELEQNRSAVACLGRLRRWTGDFEKPLSELRFGENSLLWDRSVLNSVGWYDTCRFGGDSEFRERIIGRYGKSAIAYISDELYYLRSSQGSLTLSDGSLAYSMTNGMLEQKLSPKRLRYQDSFRGWHATLKDTEIVDFPQFHRRLELGSSDQNASPSLGQRCVGSMASYPKRRESLRRALPLLLSQLDQLTLYLNDYDEVPDFCRHPRLRVILGKDAVGDLRDNGKFFDFPMDENCYFFTFDDDILYPHDYVRRMVHYIEILDRKAIVGVHGVKFPDVNFSQLAQRTVYTFNQGHYGTFVDLLGTGTTAWHSSILKPRLTDFLTKGLCDLWFARLATVSGIPMFNVPREKGWLQQIEGNDETLWAEATQRPEGYFNVWETHLSSLFLGERLRERALAGLKERYPAAAIIAAFGHQLFVR